MNATKTPTAADTNFGRRPLARLADSARHAAGAASALNRLLKETGRKSIEVAAFGSSV